MNPLSDTKINDTAVKIASEENFPSVVNADFFQRIYSTPFEKYKQRLSSIGFTNLNNVLDAGCGFGQWSLAMSENNKSVTSFDLDIFRCNIVNNFQNHLKISNLSVEQASILSIPHKSDTFDAVFSYGTIFLTDWKIALEELLRVLKPNGVLYFSSMNIGWYVYNLLYSHNDSDDYSSRKMAFKSISTSINNKLFSSCPSANSQLIMTKSGVKKVLNNLGAKDIVIAGDGLSGDWGDKAPVKFNSERKLGLPSAFEALCRKRST